MKILFGGSAIFASALLATSVLFSAHSSVAETTHNASDSKQQKTQPPKPIASVEVPSILDAPASVGIAPSSSPAVPLTLNITDSPPIMKKIEMRAEKLVLPTTQTYVATAYSLYGRTASGRFVSKGIIAADHRVLPLGTRVRLEAGSYSGEYLVADTGGAIRGRKIDVWVPSTREALRFGRRSIKLTVLNYGVRRIKSSSKARSS
jgi:3D (Asp-Asp-Asp) domain-containing protein